MSQGSYRNVLEHFLTDATLNDLEVGRYSKISGSPFAESPMPHKAQRAFPSESTLMKSPVSAKKLGGR